MKRGNGKEKRDVDMKEWKSEGEGDGREGR